MTAEARDEEHSGSLASRTIYRWDLDKTYLRTEFDTLRALLRTAFEPASGKRTVPGAAALLRELQATRPAGIFILSGSPEQMRRVLETKLRLDGIQWNALTLKPSVRNLVRGRFRFLRDQVGYKLSCLLTERSQADADCDDVLFGDDAEADAFVYSLYADVCAGRVSREALAEVLDRANLTEDETARLIELRDRLPRRAATRRIFIHLDRVTAPDVFGELGSRLVAFYNYFQPALVLVEDGLLDGQAALRVGLDLAQGHGFGPETLLASFEDLVERRCIGPTCVERLLAAHDTSWKALAGGSPVSLRTLVEEMEHCRGRLSTPAAPQPLDVDYASLFGRDRARVRQAARAARRRARSRYL